MTLRFVLRATWAEWRRLPAALRLERLARKAVSPVVESGRLKVYRWAIEDAPLDTVDRGSGFEGREATRVELPAVAAALDRDPRTFEERALRGERCFTAWSVGTPVHMRWVATQPTLVPELGMYLCPAAGEAYVYDAFTDPANRGRYATAAARLAMHGAFRADGIRTAFAYVRSDNVPSLKALSSYHHVLFELGFARWHRSGKPRIFGRPRHPLYPASVVLAPGKPAALPLFLERESRPPRHPAVFR